VSPRKPLGRSSHNPDPDGLGAGRSLQTRALSGQLLELALVFCSIGTGSLLGLLGPLGRLLWVPDGPLLAVLPRPSVALSSPIYAGDLLGLFGALGRLLGMLRALFAHGASFFPLRRAAGKRFSSRYASYTGPPYPRGGYLPQTLMPFSSRVSSTVLSQLSSILLAIASSSARFRRATSAVSGSPALSARRSRSW
jgi:hypothetical protein